VFALARKLGMTVARLQAEMTSAELTEWAAFFTLEAIEQEQQAAAQRAKARMR
jgi:hypothetical protein